MSIYDAPSDDLTVFLLAQLAEDQRTARAAAVFTDAYDDEPSDDGVEWTAHGGDVWTREVQILLRAHVIGSEGPGELAARFDPARVLTEVDAKLQIIAEHRAATPDGSEVEEFPDGYCTTCQLEDWAPTSGWPCTTMRALVLPYAGRDGYQPGWAIPEPGAPQELTPTWGTNLAVLADDVDATVPLTGQELIAHEEGDTEGVRGARLRIRRSGTTVWLDALQAVPPGSGVFPAFDVQSLDTTRRVVVSTQPAQGHRDPFRDTRPDLCDHYAAAGRCPVGGCTHG